MSVRLYVTLECMAGVPGCVSERCQCLCHNDPCPAECRHEMPGGYVTTFKIDVEGFWPEPGTAGFHEQWLIAEWAKALTSCSGRPLGIPTVWVDLNAYGITNQCPPDVVDFMMERHGIMPRSPAMWHAEGSAERMPDHGGQ